MKLLGVSAAVQEAALLGKTKVAERGLRALRDVLVW